MINFADTPLIAIYLAVNLLLFGSFIAAGVGIIFKLTRLSSPRARYLVAICAFFIATFYPLWITFNSSGDFKAAAPKFNITSEISNENLTIAANIPNNIQTSEKTIEQPDKSYNFSLPEVTETLVKSGAGTFFLYTWMVIALLLIGKDLMGYMRLTLIRRKWKPAPPELRAELQWDNLFPLLVSEENGPATIGFFRPAVVIPSAMIESVSLEAARHITRHELSHARWRDPLANMLVRLTRAVFWISPALWLLEKTIRIEREVSADREAINSAVHTANENSDRAVEYADSLLQVICFLKTTARQDEGKMMTRFFTLGGKGSLEYRVNRLFAPVSQPSYIGVSLALLVFIASVSGAAYLPLPKFSLIENETASLDPKPENLPVLSKPSEEGTRDIPEQIKTSPAIAKNNSQPVPTLAANQAQSKEIIANNGSNKELETEQVKKPLENETVPVKTDSAPVSVEEKINVTSISKPNPVGTDNSFESLISVLNDSNPSVRQQAAASLKNSRDSRATQHLIRLLNDSSAGVREQAADALGAIGDQRAIKPLIKALKDENSQVRQMSSKSLGRMGAAEAIEPLQEMSADNNRTVRQAAESSVNRLLANGKKKE